MRKGYTKKRVVLGLILLMAVGLTGCGDEVDSELPDIDIAAKTTEDGSEIDSGNTEQSCETAAIPNGEYIIIHDGENCETEYIVTQNVEIDGMSTGNISDGNIVTEIQENEDSHMSFDEYQNNVSNLQDDIVEGKVTDEEITVNPGNSAR